MVNHYKVEGYENYLKFMKEFDTKNKEIYLMFSGSKLPTGENWCSDCREGYYYLF